MTRQETVWYAPADQCSSIIAPVSTVLTEDALQRSARSSRPTPFTVAWCHCREVRHLIPSLPVFCSHTPPNLYLLRLLSGRNNIRTIFLNKGSSFSLRAWDMEPMKDLASVFSCCSSPEYRLGISRSLCLRFYASPSALCSLRCMHTECISKRYASLKATFWSSLSRSIFDDAQIVQTCKSTSTHIIHTLLSWALDLRSIAKSV